MTTEQKLAIIATYKKPVIYMHPDCKLTIPNIPIKTSGWIDRETFVVIDEDTNPFLNVSMMDNILPILNA